MSIIAVDFDGTVVTHDYPNIGKDIGAIPVLKKLVAKGHKLILFSMRSDIDEVSHEKLVDYLGKGHFLTDAVNWYKENGIELHGVNVNPDTIEWSGTPKPDADYFIDDRSIGCPLIENEMYSSKPYADWIKIEEILIRKGVL